MGHKLRAALALSLSDWAVFFPAWLMLLVVDLGLRVLPFPRVRKLVASSKQPGRAASQRDVRLELCRLEWLVDIAARNHLYPMTCLRQALTLQWLLARRGVAADLRIGVRKQAGALEAHAWVECAGQAIRSAETVDVFAPLVGVKPI